MQGDVKHFPIGMVIFEVDNGKFKFFRFNDPMGYNLMKRFDIQMAEIDPAFVNWEMIKQANGFSYSPRLRLQQRFTGLIYPTYIYVESRNLIVHGLSILLICNYLCQLLSCRFLLCWCELNCCTVNTYIWLTNKYLVLHKTFHSKKFLFFYIAQPAHNNI